MTGGIHRGIVSEPQARSSSAAHSIAVPPEIVRKWQEFVNLLAEIMHVPSAAIMRVDPPGIKVFVSSTSDGNPCEPGALDTGPYCETVMKTGQPLLVRDALENEAWQANPHVRLGMISYLGVPIGWPDGRLFGTICVRDNSCCCTSATSCRPTWSHSQRYTAGSNSTKQRSGGWSTPTSSGSSSGISTAA